MAWLMETFGWGLIPMFFFAVIIAVIGGIGYFLGRK